MQFQWMICRWIRLCAACGISRLLVTAKEFKTLSTGFLSNLLQSHIFASMEKNILRNFQHREAALQQVTSHKILACVMEDGILWPTQWSDSEKTLCEISSIQKLFCDRQLYTMVWQRKASVTEFGCLWRSSNGWSADESDFAQRVESPGFSSLQKNSLLFQRDFSQIYSNPIFLRQWKNIVRNFQHREAALQQVISHKDLACVMEDGILWPTQWSDSEKTLCEISSIQKLFCDRQLYTMVWQRKASVTEFGCLWMICRWIRLCAACGISRLLVTAKEFPTPSTGFLSNLLQSHIFASMEKILYEISSTEKPRCNR